MEWVETTGKSVEEAKEAALDQLGVAEEDAEILVLEEPRPGLFGRVRGEARVRARVRPTQPRPKEDRRDRRRRRPDRGGRGGNGSAGGEETGGEDGDGGSSDAEEVGADTEETARRGARSGRAGAEARSSSGRTPRAQAGGAGGAARAGGRAGGRRAGGMQTDQAPDRGDDRAADRAEDMAEDMEETVVDEDISLEEQGAEAAEFLSGLLSRMDLSGDVAVELIDEETVEVRITGGDLGILIGPKGATLSSVQELTRTVVQRQLGAHNGRLLVDVAGYRQKRKAALERFTQQVADEVRSTGERRVLEPMSAADRKIVHDTANGIDGVSTTSEGEEPRRRVVILPS